MVTLVEGYSPRIQGPPRAARAVGGDKDLPHERSGQFLAMSPRVEGDAQQSVFIWWYGHRFQRGLGTTARGGYRFYD